MTLSKVSRNIIIQALLGLAWAPAASAQADFHLAEDFIAPVPQGGKKLPGLDLKDLQKQGPKTLSQLMAAKRKDTASHIPTPFIINPNRPELVEKQKAALAEESELLKEAERLLQDELLTKASQPGFVKTIKTQASDRVGSTVRLSASNRKLHIEPASLDIGMDRVSVTFDGLEASPQIFLRDSSKLAWDSEKRQFQGKASGTTEVFIVYFDEMYILPVTISTDTRKDLISDNRSLEHLSSVLPMQQNSFAKFQGAPETSKDERYDLSIADASLDAKKTLEKSKAEQSLFVYDDKAKSYKDTAIQVMDVRSNPREGRIFPVSGVTVQLLGTSAHTDTDSTGIARFGELPANGRVWALLADKEGRIVPTAGELVISSKGEVQRMRTMTYQTYVNYLNVFNTNQDWSKGSICARAMDTSGKNAVEGLSAQINDDRADGPYYFSEYGPQPSSDRTDASGRFCFFNVKPGLAEITFFRGNQFETALTLPIFPGAHSEEDLPLGTGNGRQVVLASLANAMDQLYGEDEAAQYKETVDTANVIAVGENESMHQVSEKILGLEGGRSEFKGRQYSLVQTAEFENTLYAQDRQKPSAGRMSVLPLLQRGFVEDLFNELNQQDNVASIAFDPAMGQLLVYHHLDADKDVQITISDAYGKQMEQGWYFGSPSQGLMKAAFFNLQPGMYTVKVQKADGALIAIDTVAVDFWTTGFVQTGADLQLDIASSATDSDQQQASAD